MRGMSLNQTPQGERTHIAIFGRRNAGKSSLINALTGQEVAIVSEVKGTTTDPVRKTMELLPLGPVMIIDTAGLDDEGALGALRLQRTRDVLNQTDIALLVTEAEFGLGGCERELVQQVRAKNIPLVVVFNKANRGARIAVLKRLPRSSVRPRGFFDDEGRHRGAQADLGADGAGGRQPAPARRRLQRTRSLCW